MDAMVNLQFQKDNPKVVQAFKMEDGGVLMRVTENTRKRLETMWNH